jgi:hypothetical protein
VEVTAREKKDCHTLVDHGATLIDCMVHMVEPPSKYMVHMVVNGWARLVIVDEIMDAIGENGTMSLRPVTMTGLADTLPLDCAGVGTGRTAVSRSGTHLCLHMTTFAKIGADFYSKSCLEKLF